MVRRRWGVDFVDVRDDMVGGVESVAGSGMRANESDEVLRDVSVVICIQTSRGI